ncbi:MAG: DUF3021 family protein [Lachnospiraceae bacterium]|nr:DUF3021 family protein [Lachnospiraceae bacterium]
MKLKSKLEKALKLYFILVTLITVLLMILGQVLDKDRTFGYQVFASPLIYAALGVIPVFLFDKEKELSVRELIFRRIAELAVVEVAVLLLAFFAESIPTEKPAVVTGIAAGVAVVYGLTFLVEYIIELLESKEMNEYLKDYQEKNTELK